MGHGAESLGIFPYAPGSMPFAFTSISSDFLNFFINSSLIL
jgi:hypothetical protein